MSFAHIQMLTQNRQPHETQAGVRYKTLDSAVAEFTALMDRVLEAEDRAASCTCQPAKGFDPFRRETRLDFDLKLRRFKGMRVVDEAVEAELFGATS